MPLFLASSLIAAALSASSSVALGQEEAGTFALELPPGPAARAWAGVGPDTIPATLSPGLTALAALAAGSERPPEAPKSQGELWSQAATWELWAERVDFVRSRLTAAQDPASVGAPRDSELSSARADLALLAGSQGRSRDAWAHFGALTDSPEFAARVAPCLIPGVSLDAPIGPGGVPAPLIDGVLLRPITPEYPANDPAMDRAPRSARVQGLPVAGSALGALLSVDALGVEFTFELSSGSTVEVRGQLPEPADHSIRYEYLDWTKVDSIGIPQTVRLLPGDEEPHVLYGRIETAPWPWPAGRPGHLAATLEQGGLWLVLDPADPEHAVWSAAAKACGDLLGVPAGMRPPGQPGASGREGLELSVPLPMAPKERGRAGNRAAFGRYLASSLEVQLRIHP